MGSVRISRALDEARTVFVDTSPFIYLVAQHPAYVDKIRAVFHETNLRDLQILTSVITLTETLAKPLKAQDKALEQAYTALFLTTPNLHTLSLNPPIAVEAACLRAQFNLRLGDALQMAVALTAQCDVFLTNDIGFRRIHTIRVVLVDDLELDLPP